MKTPHLEPWVTGASLAFEGCENERMRTLAFYGVDTLADDPELCAIVRFAAKLCDAPMALVSMVESDRQRFIARHGLAEIETPRDVSFCAHAMLMDDVMIVPDARHDPRFAHNALVLGAPHIRFYAGQPLVSEDGFPLGGLCVIDTVPREHGLTQLQREGLALLGQAVMRRLRAKREELAAQLRLEEREVQLRALADAMPALVWSTDGEGNFDYLNRRMMEFIGLNKRFDAYAIHPDDRALTAAKWRECLREAKPYEIEHRIRRDDGEYCWMMTRADPVKDSAGRVIRWFGTAIDIDAVHRVSERHELLAGELSHRIKNIFAVVSGLISLSVREQPEHRKFADELIGTIRALGRAHDYVRPVDGEQGGSLLGMLQDLFGPYVRKGSPQVRVVGDDVAVAPRAATPLALVFHELATNSAKYGALSDKDGVVDLSIESNDDTLLLRWVERGGPPVQSKRTEGFGSRLVEMSISRQLDGSWRRYFEPAGLICELTVAKDSICPRARRKKELPARGGGAHKL